MHKLYSSLFVVNCSVGQDKIQYEHPDGLFGGLEHGDGDGWFITAIVPEEV